MGVFAPERVPEGHLGAKGGVSAPVSLGNRKQSVYLAEREFKYLRYLLVV